MDHYTERRGGGVIDLVGKSGPEIAPPNTEKRKVTSLFRKTCPHMSAPETHSEADQGRLNASSTAQKNPRAIEAYPPTRGRCPNRRNAGPPRTRSICQKSLE
jgi:hypothetical protein